MKALIPILCILVFSSCSLFKTTTRNSWKEEVREKIDSTLKIVVAEKESLLTTEDATTGTTQIIKATEIEINSDGSIKATGGVEVRYQKSESKKLFSDGNKEKYNEFAAATTITSDSTSKKTNKTSEPSKKAFDITGKWIFITIGFIFLVIYLGWKFKGLFKWKVKAPD